MPLSYYGAPIYSSYSNPYSLGPYANHSSIIAANYSRSPSSSYTKPFRIRSSFTPFLATISEAHAASRPMTRITSPKLVLHSSPKFKMPRPISINTADIDVSVNKYRKFKQITRAPDKSEFKKEPENISTPSSTIETESEEHIPGKFPIKRDRALVRLHTIHRRSKDKPSEKEKNQPKFTRKWRDAFDEEQKPQKTEKKIERSPAERLLEKHLIKDKTEEEEKLRLIEEQKNKRNKNLLKHTEENKDLIRKSPSFHDICESISLDNITEDLNPGQPEHIKRRQTRQLSTEEILNQVRRNSAEFINDNVIIDKLGMKECLDKPNEDSDLSAKNREDTRTSVKRKKKIVRKKTSENLDEDSKDPATKPMLQRRPTLKKIKRTSTERNLPLTLELDEKCNEEYQNAIRDISQVEVEEIKVKPKPKPVITSTVDVENTKSNLKAIIVDDVFIEEFPTVKSPKFKLEFTIHNIEDNIDQDQSVNFNKNEKLKKLPNASESKEIKSEIESKQIVDNIRTDPQNKCKDVTTSNKTKKIVPKKIEEKPKPQEELIKSLNFPVKELHAINTVTPKSDRAKTEKKENLKSVDIIPKKEESAIVDKFTKKEETLKIDKKPTNSILNEEKVKKPVDTKNIQDQRSKTSEEKKLEETKSKPIVNETLKDVNVSSKSKPLLKEEVQSPPLDQITDSHNDKSKTPTPNLEKLQSDILKNKYKQLEIANQINMIKQEIEKKRKKSDSQMTEISTNDAMQIPQTTRPVISKVVTKKHTARMGDILEDINAPPPRKVKQKIIPKSENTEKVLTKKSTSAIEKSSSTDSVNFWDQIGTRETVQFKNRKVIERSIEDDSVPEFKKSQEDKIDSILNTDSHISGIRKEPKDEIKAVSQKIFDVAEKSKEQIKTENQISDTAKITKEEIKTESRISDTAKKSKEEIKTESRISDTAKKSKEEIKTERQISDTAKQSKEDTKTERQISDTAKEAKEEIKIESEISDTTKESQEEIKTIEGIKFKVTSKRSLVVKPKVNDPDLQVFVPPEEEPKPEPSEEEQANQEGKFVPLQSNRLSDWMHPFQKPVQLEVCPIEIYARPKIIRGRHYPRPKYPPAPSAPSLKDDSSDSDSSDSEESSEEESDSSQDETNASSTQTGTSTSSNDSGFDSSAPGSPSNRRYDHGSSENRDSPSSNPALNPAFAVDSGDTISEDILQSCTFTGYQKSGRITPPATTMPRFRKYTIDDFQFLKVLGKGSFGKVMLAELKNTEYYYAVKCLKKDVVLEDDDVECTLIERKVLALGTKHPYLCHLLCTFQTESHLFFIMEYLNGGDLMFHIQQSGRFAESRAKFYAAEIASGLRFLHSKGIVYRDLKLDNILLDFDGHVRIADFGMCKLQIFLDRTADTFCGTPDYMAPEIIKGQHYNQCVDWWSYGVLLYEMLIGQSPFSGCDEDELFWSICNEKPVIPRFLSTEANAILLLFLEKDAGKRLGNRMCPAGIIQDQPFFKAIDWDRLEARLLEPPFKPKLQHPLDTQYFDKTFTVEKAKLTPIEKNILQSMDQTQFQGFSYTNPNATDK